jgi:hypothetical protein
MESSVTLSVVIVTYNSSLFLTDCLTSVLRQGGTLAYEVIVVENASTDRSLDILRGQFPAARVIRNSANRGFTAANNQAIEAATGKYILLLNPDTVVHAGCLEIMVRFMDAHQEAGAAGPKICNEDGSLQRTGVTFPSLWNVFVESLFLDDLFPSSRIFGQHRRLYDNPDLVHDVDYLQGSCLCIRRRALDDAGFLDEDFFMYFEETDICYRLKQHGWKILYNPSASIVHAGGSGGTFYGKQQLVEFHRSYLTFLRKHEPSARRLVFRIVLLFRSAVRMFLFVLGSMVPSRREEFLSRSAGYFIVALQMIGVKR